jgi:putative ABC transport system ATP-binding protein
MSNQLTHLVLPPNGSGPGFIRLDHVNKTFQEGDRKRVVLDGVVAGFAEGEIVAIVGRSGSGKSTLLNLLAGLDMPDKGSIWVGAICVTSLNDRGRTLFRRGHIGFVFQFFNLIPTLTVGENVRLTAELSGWPAADAQKQADQMLAEVGLLDRARAYSDKLSGGEQQRVAIARALCADPPLILADEPTGNLDVDTGAQVMQLLARLTRERGKTLIVVTHSAEIAAMADRVFRLDHGRLVAESVAPEAVQTAAR